MVIAEYHDPAGVFALLHADLTSRLPLRNLNWKSPTRPLRNIDTLHVVFVPDKDAAGSANSSISRSNSLRSVKKKTSNDSIWPTRPEAGQRSVSQPVGGEPSQRERRHQIPGLRETPYLKLFILRCDDKETYRTEYRQQLRDWVKNISPKSSQSTTALNKHDNHDAYEWMIIHVVFPDTQAASEPRWTAAKNDPDELAERSKSKTKWTSKGTSTVFDKIRADFHPASKSALERVAQIRLPKSSVPPALLPRVPILPTLTETPQEQENAWQDLVSKFKTLILQSFDYRVAQYEEDVRDREAQRALPGWNFCTFFTLKEGLAKAFESVGLVEDALAIYDELAVGLDATTHDNTAFLGDLAHLRRELTSLATNGAEDDGAETRKRLSELLASPLDVNHKDYRGLIVSSTISLFDFHIYIFACQRLLIYRLGSFEPKDAKIDEARTPQSAINAASDKTEKARSGSQLHYLAEVCRRASAFISSNARTLITEMETSSSLVDQRKYDGIVQSVAASWAFATAEKVLAETSVSMYYAPSADPTPRDGGFSFPQGANAFPSRKSSLVPSPASRSSVVIYENDKFNPAGGDTVKPAPAGSGLAELAACRGDLCLLQRRFLETLAEKKGWQTGWAAVKSIASSLGSNGTLSGSSLGHAFDSSDINFLDDDLLTSLKSEDAFRTSYEELTDLAIRHLMLGNRLGVVESLLGDLALLKYQKGDYTGAAQLLQKLVPKYLNGGWSPIESGIASIYTRCLQMLNRKDEYVRMTLVVLRQNFGRSSSMHSSAHSKASQSASGNTLEELVEASKDLTVPYRTSFEDFFGTPEIDPYISLSGTIDGFKMSVRFKSFFEHSFRADTIKMKMISTAETPQDIWLQSEVPQQISRGFNEITVSTSVSAFGLFAISSITIEVGKLQFAHSFEPKQKRPSLPLIDRSNGAEPRRPFGPIVMLFQRSQALDVSVMACPDVYMDQSRSLHIQVEAGDTDSEEVILRLKPSTAGLRLHTSDAREVGADMTSVSRDTAGALKFSLKAGESLLLNVPYSLESAQPELLIRMEAVTKRDGKDYTFLFEDEISTDLMLDVDVNDIFTPAELFSRFSIRSTNQDPVLLRSVDLAGSEIFSVDVLACPQNQIISAKQALSLGCKVSKVASDSEGSSSGGVGGGLRLSLHYLPILGFLVETVAKGFDKAISASPVTHLRRLLLPTMKQLLYEHVGSTVLENGMIMEEFELPRYDTMNWADHLIAVSPHERATVRTFLQDWHGQHATESFQYGDLVDVGSRALTIQVDVPSIGILLTCSLDMSCSKSTSASLPRIATVGEPIESQLCMSYTRKWDKNQPPKAPEANALLSPDLHGDRQELPASESTFVFNIVETTDWLIAGPSYGTFTAPEDQMTTIPLLLIPLVPGVLSLPTVEIDLASGRSGETPVPTPSSAAPSSAGARTVLDHGALGRYACEVNYESAAETVLVLRAPGDVDVSVLDAVSTTYMSPPMPVVQPQVQQTSQDVARPSSVENVRRSTEIMGLGLH